LINRKKGSSDVFLLFGYSVVSFDFKHEAYDKMVQKWILLLDKGRKQAARKYEIKLLIARQLAMRAMAKADRA